MLFLGLFQDLLELRTELVSDMAGGDTGLWTITVDSSDETSEQMLALDCAPGTLMRDRMEAK